VTAAARRLGVHVNTVRAWTDQGRLSCLRINDRGDRRYLPDEIDRFLGAAAGASVAVGVGRRSRSTGSAGTNSVGLATLQAIAERCVGPTDDPAEILAAVADVLCTSGGYLAASYVAPDGEVVALRGRLETAPTLARAAMRRDRPVRGSRDGRSLYRTVALPVRDGTLATGALVLRRAESGILAGAEEMALLRGVAAQLQVVKESATQRTLLANQRRRYELLLAVGDDLASELDPTRSLSRLTEHAMDIFQAQHAAIYRHSRAGHLVADAVRNLSPEFVRSVETAPRLPLVEEALESGKTASTPDWPDKSPPGPLRQSMLDADINTVTVAPLISDGEHLGVLALYHDDRYTWADEGLATLELLAHQGALALKNASNFGRMATWAAQLQSIQQLGARLTRLSSVGDIGQAIVAELHQLIDYHNVRVYRVEGDAVLPVAWRGEVGEYTSEDGTQLRVRVGQGITGWVALHGLAQNLGDAASDPRTETIPGTEDDLPESLLVAPMLYEGRVIGLIVLAKLGLNQFGADDLRLLEIYASIASQAIVNADATERLRAQSATLERQVQSQRQLLRVTESILGTLDTPALLEEIASRLGTLLQVDNISVDVYDEQAGVLRPIYAEGTHAIRNLGRAPAQDEGVANHVLQTGEAVLVQNEANDRQGPHLAPPGLLAGARIVVPLRSRDRVTGLLTIERMGETAHFSQEDFELIKLFAGHVSIALHNAAAHEAVELRAQSDGLTGLRNQGSLNLDVARAVQHGNPFSLLMIDLDHFKDVNDRRGHQAGSSILEALAALLPSACREADVVYRYGGDEFAILLPHTTGDGAMGVAAKVATAIRKMTDGPRSAIRITASIGVATFPIDGVDGASVLLAADRACYAAKRNGRNRIATAAEGLALAAEFLPTVTPVDEPDVAYPAA
jgi:diguanylate cyclase (GGDEF)-like protein